MSEPMFPHLDISQTNYSVKPVSGPSSSYNVNSTFGRGYREIIQGDGSVNYFCEICSLMVTTLGSLQKHMNALHKSARLLPYICPVCEHGFFSPSGMESHRLVHIRGRKYECGICGYRFNYKHHLKRHEMSVHKL
ncbi:Zinc finger protein draculin [Plakobranchus ocellatus]|uniref:Zinc finger protein draculin n=1 Tax=Plakobranchus ocellatus TaxID=259542 RepID=A0AAV3ZE09_9GAST|nr:Zinc finger protein draculin [Plakobranchus ocellatus]